MKRVLDDLNLFCEVVEQGSLKAASMSTGIPHSTVSRRIEALELALGLTLLQRTTREVTVTPRGKELYLDCSVLFNNLRDSIALAEDAEATFKGPLNVSMPVRAGIDFLGAWLIDFASEYPELKLNIALSNTNKNLIKEDIDLAFRVGPLLDSSAIALHLWDIPYSVCAHRSYLEKYNLSQNRVTEHQISTLPCIVAHPAKQWSFLNASSNEVMLSPLQSLVVDDLGLAYHGVLTGKYMAMLPNSMIKSDDVVRLAVDNLNPRTRVMYAYYFGKRHVQSQIKQLVQYIKNRFQKNLQTPI
ncbi:LysR family transcriptional regulator [Pseudoalteromonas luteoviolacea]|uniref:LysR family transcriptional regulator n=1 Tax=Pseudoalteromonas luteoviolacea TaxID=43657 RepID=UPI001B3716F9|nr:LysR family transcriptional regulator [Pseudoalteromonas luteoviolacea]MBQ4810225.1 LysR family transcriptional regulator [Pseudoalteromonas luteoviolacea]